MVKKIKFKSFKEAAEVQKVLETYLPMGSATPIDVFSFLGEEKLRHGRLINNSEFAHTRFRSPFEHHITAFAPAKGFIFAAHWRIIFSFNNQKLAKIEVTYGGDGW